MLSVIPDMMTLEEAEDAIAEFSVLSIVHDGLMTSGQAARVIGVPLGTIGTWIARGRFTVMHVLGATMLPQQEVAAMRFWYREASATAARGRGQKAPTAAELVKAGWGDMKELSDEDSAVSVG